MKYKVEKDSSDSRRIIIVIPARGGSKGIPRKNLRPLSGFPLIYYSIKASLDSNFASRVVVSTDDDEISMFSERFGAEIVGRSQELSNDTATLDPVIFDAVKSSESKFNEHYDIVVTVQPTSPLVISYDIDKIIKTLINSECDTALTVVDDRHLRWKIDNGEVVPLYERRVNRQSLPLAFKETGAVIACTREQINSGTRIGKRVAICEMPYERSFDIDTYADLYLCEALISRKTIIFTVVGYAEVGLGHAYRAVMLAHELVQYKLLFICEERSELAAEFIKSNNYEVIVTSNGLLADTVISFKPDLVINDILDTSEEYMGKLCAREIRCVNFEDLGPGHTRAEIVINALYPDRCTAKNVLVGPKYFCLRDEFIYLGSLDKNKCFDEVQRVLITFGGVDEGNLTEITFREIVHFCDSKRICIDIVTGPGYSHKEQLMRTVSSFNLEISCRIVEHTKRISEYMSQADVAFTSAGRTVLELASLHVPMLVICQNAREKTHTFASPENGIVNLGIRDQLQPGKILEKFEEIVTCKSARTEMVTKMKRIDLKRGKSRVIKILKSLVN